MHTFDIIVVGSGCAGAMAAQTLVEAGQKVAMIDVGETSPNYDRITPSDNFLHLRRTDPNQYRYFLGEKAEGIIRDDKGKGSQITPTRQHLERNVGSYVPLVSDTFTPIESLGYGGLGIGWGLQCWEFSQKEIEAAGMDPERMAKAYELISKRIGISATRDVAAPYTLGKLQTYLKSVKADNSMIHIYSRYAAKQAYFLKKGFYFGRTPLALLTRDQGTRKKYAYRDMDFYDDNEQSAWRPWITVNQLRKKANFTYINGFLASSFDDAGAYVTIRGVDLTTKKAVAYKCRKLVLACNALGTARITLRSLQPKMGYKVPFLCNPYTYIPCIQPSFFGKAADTKIGFGQLSGFLSEESSRQATSILTLYSYQSLMLFRIIRQIPLNFVDARIISQYLNSGLVVAGVQHSDKLTPTKTLHLEKNNQSPTKDQLRATYILSEEELKDQKRREGLYVRYLRKMGVYGIKRINPGYGSSVHYAGTLPFSTKDTPLTLSPTGKVHGTKNVYVADSSGFNFLPARGLTFSILANAHITAENVLQDGK